MNEGPSPTENEESGEGDYESMASEDETVEVSRSRYQELIDSHSTAEKVKQVIDQDPPYQGIPVHKKKVDHSYKSNPVEESNLESKQENTIQYADVTRKDHTDNRIEEDLEVFRRSALWAAIGSFAILATVVSFAFVGLLSVPKVVLLGGILSLTILLFLKIWYDVSD